MTETVEVDICEKTTVTTTTKMILYEPYNGIPYTDTAEY